MVTNGDVSVLVIYGKTNTLYILIDKNAHLHSEWIPQPQQKSGAS